MRERAWRTVVEKERDWLWRRSAAGCSGCLGTRAGMACHVEVLVAGFARTLARTRSPVFEMANLGACKLHDG